MKSTDKEKLLLRYLLNKSLDGDITDEEIQEFHKLIDDYPDLQDYYVKCIHMYYVLQEASVGSELNFINGLVLDEQTWSDMEVLEGAAPKIEIFKPKPEPEVAPEKFSPPTSVQNRHLTRFELIGFGMTAAAVLFIAFLVIFAPQKNYTREVATLTDQLNVQWGNLDSQLSTGQRLLAGDRSISLESGIIKVIYDNEVEVLIEGPALFKIENSGVFLNYGRLFSSVSEAGKGFCVETPGCKFVDLGTEFCVQADINNSAEIHVIKGEVQLLAENASQEMGDMIVQENNAVRFDNYTRETVDIPIKTEVFARNVDSRFNVVWRGHQMLCLADIVGGGNGLGSGEINTGIDSLRGRYTKQLDMLYYVRNTDYFEVPLPFIDGVFVPDNNGKAVKVSSTGNVFIDCPDTSGRFRGGIRNGGLYWAQQGKPQQLTLAGEVYGIEEKPAILMQANQGITFDLAQLRESLMGVDITGFSAICGLSDSVLELSDEFSVDDPKTLPVGDFWVLVDGEVRFSRIGQSPSDKPVAVDIAIGKKDRFLSLVTSDSNSSITYSWAMFAEPMLHVGNYE